MIWLSLAGTVVAVLTVLAGYYLWRLRNLRKRQAQQLAVLRQEGEKRRMSIRKSIAVLVQAIRNDDQNLTLTEACIRIGGLMDSYGLSSEFKAGYQAIYDLSNATCHIPNNEKWRELSTKKRMAYDRERREIEAEFHEAVNAAFTRLSTESEFKVH